MLALKIETTSLGTCSVAPHYFSVRRFPDARQVSLNKVSATPEAMQLLNEIIADHGPVLFHQSGGCCGGSSPMCYPRDDLIVGDRDVLLGTVADTPVYISESQFEVWKHTDLIIDVVPGRGGMFSLDNGREKRS